MSWCCGSSTLQPPSRRCIRRQLCRSSASRKNIFRGFRRQHVSTPHFMLGCPRSRACFRSRGNCDWRVSSAMVFMVFRANRSCISLREGVRCESGTSFARRGGRDTACAREANLPFAPSSRGLRALFFLLLFLLMFCPRTYVQDGNRLPSRTFEFSDYWRSRRRGGRPTLPTEIRKLTRSVRGTPTDRPRAS